MRRHALALLAASALLALGGAARADLYRWVDDTGAVHYATDLDAVPREFRDTAQQIQKPPPRRVVRRATAAPQAAPPSEVPPSAAPSEPASVLAPAGPAPATPAPGPSAPALSAPALTAREPTAPELTTPATVAPAPSAPTAAAPPGPLPGPPSARALAPDDPRAAEAAELEAQIARDRETLRQMISTPRWDSSELAKDPQIREIAERLPRLQAELEALRREPAP